MEAIALITPRVKNALLALARRLTGDGLVAQEIVADAVLRVVERVATIQKKSFFSWIYTITRNLATDWWRREQRRRRCLSKGDWKVSDRGAGSVAMSREACELFDRLLRTLPKRMRQYVRYRVLHGMSNREIAARTGQSVIAVRNVAFRLRQRLEGWRELVVS